MKITVGVNHHNEYAECDAVAFRVEIDTRLAQTILQHMNELKERNDICYYSTFTHDGAYLSISQLEGTTDTTEIRVELSMRVISSSEVYWQATYKHSNMTMESARIPRKLIQRRAGGEVELLECELKELWPEREEYLPA